MNPDMNTNSSPSEIGSDSHDVAAPQPSWPKNWPVPESFLCSLTKRPMVYPVIDREGNSYERDAIFAHLLNLNGQGFSPITNNPMHESDLVDNKGLELAIDAALKNALEQVESQPRRRGRRSRLTFKGSLTASLTSAGSRSLTASMTKGADVLQKMAAIGRGKQGDDNGDDEKWESPSMILTENGGSEVNGSFGERRTSSDHSSRTERSAQREQEPLQPSDLGGASNRESNAMQREYSLRIEELRVDEDSAEVPAENSHSSLNRRAAPSRKRSEFGSMTSSKGSLDAGINAFLQSGMLNDSRSSVISDVRAYSSAKTWRNSGGSQVAMHQPNSADDKFEERLRCKLSEDTAHKANYQPKSQVDEDERLKKKLSEESAFARSKTTDSSKLSGSQIDEDERLKRKLSRERAIANALSTNSVKLQAASESAKYVPKSTKKTPEVNFDDHNVPTENKGSDTVGIFTNKSSVASKNEGEASEPRRRLSIDSGKDSSEESDGQKEKLQIHRHDHKRKSRKSRRQVLDQKAKESVTSSKDGRKEAGMPPKKGKERRKGRPRRPSIDDLAVDEYKKNIRRLTNESGRSRKSKDDMDLGGSKHRKNTSSDEHEKRDPPLDHITSAADDLKKDTDTTLRKGEEDRRRRRNRQNANEGKPEEDSQNGVVTSADPNSSGVSPGESNAPQLQSEERRRRRPNRRAMLDEKLKQSLTSSRVSYDSLDGPNEIIDASREDGSNGSEGSSRRRPNRRTMLDQKIELLKASLTDGSTTVNSGALGPVRRREKHTVQIQKFPSHESSTANSGSSGPDRMHKRHTLHIQKFSSRRLSDITIDEESELEQELLSSSAHSIPSEKGNERSRTDQLSSSMHSSSRGSETSSLPGKKEGAHGTGAIRRSSSTGKLNESSQGILHDMPLTFEGTVERNASIVSWGDLGAELETAQCLSMKANNTEALCIQHQLEAYMQGGRDVESLPSSSSSSRSMINQRRPRGRRGGCGSQDDLETQSITQKVDSILPILEGANKTRFDVIYALKQVKGDRDKALALLLGFDTSFQGGPLR